jgi:hypothetical protein
MRGERRQPSSRTDSQYRPNARAAGWLGFSRSALGGEAKTIGKMFFEHGLTQGLIEKIPAILEAPKAIYRSDTHPTNMVVLTYELKAGAP